MTAHNVSQHSYWLTRVVLLRGMALCYLAGFLTAAFQVGAAAPSRPTLAVLTVADVMTDNLLLT